MKVKVYYNLHRKLFSVVALEGHRKGRVVSYENRMILDCVTFRVSEAGRQRVLKEKRKNVHAYAVGHWPIVRWYDPPRKCQEITYNPYASGNFYIKDTGEAVSGAYAAWLEGKSIKALDIVRK